jgi:hypothetical protein
MLSVLCHAFTRLADITLPLGESGSQARRGLLKLFKQLPISRKMAAYFWEAISDSLLYTEQKFHRANPLRPLEADSPRGRVKLNS